MSRRPKVTEPAGKTIQDTQDRDPEIPEEERLMKLARSSQTLRKNVIKVSKIGSEMNVLTNMLQTNQKACLSKN